MNRSKSVICLGGVLEHKGSVLMYWRDTDQSKGTGLMLRRGTGVRAQGRCFEGVC